MAKLVWDAKNKKAVPIDKPSRQPQPELKPKNIGPEMPKEPTK